MLFLTAANALVQFSATEQVRGRVMAIYTVIMFGGQAVGSPLMGWIVQHFGAQTGMALSGFVPALVGLSFATVLARRNNLVLRVSLRRARPLLSIATAKDPVTRTTHS